MENFSKFIEGTEGLEYTIAYAAKVPLELRTRIRYVQKRISPSGSVFHDFVMADSTERALVVNAEGDVISFSTLKNFKRVKLRVFPGDVPTWRNYKKPVIFTKDWEGKALYTTNKRAYVVIHKVSTFPALVTGKVIYFRYKNTLPRDQASTISLKRLFWSLTGKFLYPTILKGLELNIDPNEQIL